MNSRNYAWVGLVAALAAALALGLFGWANVKKYGSEEITRKNNAEAPSPVTLQKGERSGSRDILSRLKPGGLPEIDVRQTKGSAPKAVAVREAGAASLRLRIPGVQIDYDAVTGAPNNIVAVGKFLTAADEAAGAEALDTVKQFVDANTSLFGHSSAALSKEKARVTREDVTAHNQMKTLVWQQELDGIPLYNTIFRVNLTGKNEVITVGSHFMADPAAASRMSPQQ